MDTKTFNEHYELDTKAKGVRARARNPADEPPEIVTADGAAYDSNRTYFYFDKSGRTVRETLALRRDGEYLGSFGLRVVQIAALHSAKDGALADAQEFCRDEIKNLQNMIAEFELQKSVQSRSLKTFLMAKE